MCPSRCAANPAAPGGVPRRWQRALRWPNGPADAPIGRSLALDCRLTVPGFEAGAPVDFFAVGREVSVGGAGSGISLAYRLAEIFRGVSQEGVTRPGASMYPCRKQIVRGPSGDVLCLADEAEGLQEQGGTPLLEPMVLQGERLVEAEDPTVAASRCVTHLARLPEGVLRLEAPEAWPLQISDGLAAAALR